VIPSSVSPQGAFLASDVVPRAEHPGASASQLQELAHELRQPLGTIESIAYYLQITSSDEKLNAQLGLIQALVTEASTILERCCAAESSSISR
jgi:nitrogen-specific signal transduction histidine kinase